MQRNISFLVYLTSVCSLLYITGDMLRKDMYLFKCKYLPHASNKHTQKVKSTQNLHHKRLYLALCVQCIFVVYGKIGPCEVRFQAGTHLVHNLKKIFCYISTQVSILLLLFFLVLSPIPHLNIRNLYSGLLLRKL